MTLKERFDTFTTPDFYSRVDSEHILELYIGLDEKGRRSIELRSAFNPLKEPCNVTLYSDSQYVCNALKLGWAKKWKANGWMRNKKEKALNPELWDKLLSLCDIHNVDVVWVKGHAGHPENERCDRLAVAEAHKFSKA